MTEQKRTRIGVIGVVIGFLLLAVGVAIAHFTGMDPVDSVGRPIYPSIPRCVFFESDPKTCWVLPITGGLIAVLGSQIAIGAIVYGWIYGRKLTWALATVGAFLFTLEMMILVGIVPNQWLNLAQGTLDWSERKIFLTIPKWLVLNNNVAISYGTLKDIIVAGYTTTVVAGVAVAAYLWQERDKRAARKAAVTTTSVYGRTVVKGSR